MHIKRLCIKKDHSCLKDFDIEFETIDENGGSSTILIGENGAGKSTMLKAILDIIISFDSDSKKSNIDYTYTLEYIYAQQNIKIRKNERFYTVIIDRERIPSRTLKTINSWLSDNKKRIFPERIVAFYSGSNNTFYENIQKVNRSLSLGYKRNFKNYTDFIKSGKVYDPLKKYKRKYIYCDESFVPIYLIAILAGENSYEKSALYKECGLSGIARIDIKLTIDSDDLFDKRTNSSYSAYKSNFKEKLFSIVDFIDSRFVELFQNGNYRFGKNRKETVSLYDIERLKIDPISLLEFFEKLKIFYKAEYSVLVENNGINVRDVDLSEGQRQLIKILGMLGVCKTEDCLVLMDEPDAHMNPRWKYNIKEIIDSVLEPDQRSENPINIQTLIATHDPLVINGVSKDYIRIFERIDGYTKVRYPDTNTEGMGIDGLLQSEYYGMPSVLDSETRKKMDEKHDLLVERKEKGKLTKTQERRLDSLTEELEDMTFSRNIPTDSYYEEFVATMHKIYKKRPKVTLTKAEIAARNAKAEEILQEILEK